MPPPSQRLSLVIPSTQNDYHYLPGILEAYASGDEKPDQVIISMSNAHQIWRNELADIESLGRRLFDSFLLLRHNRRLKHGPNRQSAVEHCDHDIISFFDSDDLPYPNRISVLKTVFENPDIVHANHCYTFIGDPPAIVEYTSPPLLADQQKLYRSYFPDDIFKDCLNVSRAYGEGLDVVFSSDRIVGIQSGHVTVRKSVFDRVKWLDWSELHEGFAEDYQFNMECVYAFRQSVIINLALSEYRRGHKTRNSFTRLAKRTYRATIGLSNRMRPGE